MVTSTSPLVSTVVTLGLVALKNKPLQPSLPIVFFGGGRKQVLVAAVQPTFRVRIHLCDAMQRGMLPLHLRVHVRFFHQNLGGNQSRQCELQLCLNS